MSVNGRQLMSDAKFYESYSRWMDSENRYETWQESVQRVMDMHRTKYKDKMSDTLAKAINKSEELYKKKAVLGAQRALQFGGEQILKNPLKMYNCFSQDTKFITKHGIKSFEDFNELDVIEVLTHTGQWKKAVVKSYGEQLLNEVEFTVGNGSASKTVLVTADHRWLLNNGKETTELGVGDSILKLPETKFVYEDLEPLEKLYWCYGYVFGDGTKVKNSKGVHTHSLVRLCKQGKDVEKYLPRFVEMGFSTSSPLSINGDAFAYTGKYLKTVPDVTKDSVELITAFVYGYLAADGRKNPDSIAELFPYTSLQSSDLDHIEFFRNVSCVAGVHITKEKDLTGEYTNFTPNGRKHTINFSIKKSSPWKVKHIKQGVKTDKVWCLEVEDDTSL